MEMTQQERIEQLIKEQYNRLVKSIEDAENTIKFSKKKLEDLQEYCLLPHFDKCFCGWSKQGNT